MNEPEDSDHSKFWLFSIKIIIDSIEKFWFVYFQSEF